MLIERKTISDLYGSIIGSNDKPGRLPSQISRLSAHEDKIVMILLVGSIVEFMNDQEYLISCGKIKQKADPRILYGEIASIMARENIRVMWCSTEWEARLTMVSFMLAVENGKIDVPARRDPTIQMARILKITPKQYLELTKTHGAISQLIKKTAKDLQCVRGIGPKKAQEILDLLTYGW